VEPDYHSAAPDARLDASSAQPSAAIHLRLDSTLAAAASQTFPAIAHCEPALPLDTATAAVAQTTTAELDESASETQLDILNNQLTKGKAQIKEVELNIRIKNFERLYPFTAVFTCIDINSGRGERPFAPTGVYLSENCCNLSLHGVNPGKIRGLSLLFCATS
jgi:hypothetical protein